MRKVTNWVAWMILLLMAVSVFAQTEQVDTRIWGIHYWKQVINKGLVKPAGETPVVPAKFTGSEIRAITVLDNNSPDVPVTTDPNTTQSENSIFVNPLDNSKVLNSNNSTNNPVSNVYGTSAFMSSDNGLTWSGQVQGTGGPNSGDPAAVIDLNGRYYVGYIADNGGQGAAYSTDEGATWTHVQIYPNPGSLADKNHFWVDNSPSSPYKGTVYSAWTDFGGPNDSEIMVSRSTDGGLTWSPAVNVSQAVNAGSHNQGVNISTGPNGEVYVIWAIYDSWPSDESAIGMAVSTDGGNTFAPATRIITNIRGIRNSETSKNMRVASFPVADVDISGGARNGWIYVVWSNIGVPGVNTGNDIDVYMIRSTDGGTTWSTPIRVNQDPIGQGKEHFFPWITCDPEVGNLSVIFYDDRNVSSSQCEVFVANSVDGGDTWEDFKVSDVAFTPSPIPGLANGYFGDYIGISARGGKVYPVWTDNRDGRAMAYVSPFFLADPDDPNPPSSVTAYSDYTTPTSIELNWVDPTTLANGTPINPSEFNIQIERDGVLIDSVNGGVQQFVDNGLNDGQTYTYTVYSKVIANDSTSLKVNVTWTAGGDKMPTAPTNFYITEAGSDFMMHWTNPKENVDGTPMDDLAGINLYEDGNLVATFTRSSADTAKMDSALYTPTPGTHFYYVTAFDNETPVNESDPSVGSYSPLSIPFADDFPTSGVPNAGFWLNTNGEVTNESVNPPSPDFALALDGHPTGGDNVELLPVDLSSYAGQGLILSYWYQPQGNGNAPEAGDSLIVEFKNDLGNWVHVKSYPGTSVQPFVNEVISIDGLNAGSGATFFHPTFQLRFRNIGTSSTSSHFDHWFVDNVFLGLPNANPIMSVSAQSLSDTLLVGATGTLSFEIANNQSAPSSLTFNIVEDPASDWLSVSPDAGVVSSSQSETITVSLDAGVVSAGTYTADLIISGNDTTNTMDTVTVTLVANDAPLIGVTPDSIHFQVASGSLDSQTVSITNLGGGPLEIYSIEDEEVANENFVPSFVQPQVATVMGAKGDEGVFRGEVTDGSGGPDPFGYKWIDSDDASGPAYSFTDISGSGTVANLQPTGTFDPKDEGMATINLPFDVKFYGQSYNQLQVNSNGFITFDMNFFANAYTNQGIPNNADPNNYIAPFWDDLDGSQNNGDIYYEQIGNKFIIQWNNWSHYSGNQNLVFQVVLYQNSSRIEFVYENMDQAQSDATVGIENMDGTMGLQISFDQAYAHNQLLTRISKGVEWVSASPTSGTVPPGGSMDITVKVNASGLSGGDYLANLIISSNDPVNPSLKLPKVAMSVVGQSNIVTTPDSLNFGDVMVGNSPQLTLTVENTGSDALNVSNIESSEGVFTVDTTNFAVPAGGSMAVMVTFTPLTATGYTGWIVVHSDDPDTPLDSTYVSGTGTAAPIAMIQPGFSNPVSVLENDSVDVTINIANAGNADLTWDAQVSLTMVSSRKVPRRVSGVVAGEQAEQVEKPVFRSQGVLTEAMWDLQKSFDLQAASGDLGNAGAEFDGQYFYTTRWASNLIHRYNMDGTLAEEFSIPGVSGLRDLAFDGTYMYGGASANTIYIMDFTNKTLVGTITTPVSVRHIAYDAANDGFWVGNWDTDIVLVDRNGSQLASIPSSSHGFGGMYGSAYDDYSSGGPYLWVFDQGLGAGNPQLLHQIDLGTGQATGVTYDVAADFPGVNGIGGGLFVSEGIVSGTASIGGVLQGNPDMFFVYELANNTPGWVKLLNSSGTIAPSANEDVNVRVYGLPAANDTAYVVIMTNDPAAPVTSIPVVQNLLTGIGGEENGIPTTYAVAQNYPNPFNPTTMIKFQLPQSDRVKLVIYNVLGQAVRTLVNNRMDAGYHHIEWDGRNDLGQSVASGIYIYRFETPNYSKVMKMILMK